MPEYTIPAAHYDTEIHVVPFEVGVDFVAKRAAYAGDGFTYCIRDNALHVVKLMPSHDIPRAGHATRY